MDHLQSGPNREPTELALERKLPATALSALALTALTACTPGETLSHSDCEWDRNKTPLNSISAEEVTNKGAFEEGGEDDRLVLVRLAEDAQVSENRKPDSITFTHPGGRNAETGTFTPAIDQEDLEIVMRVNDDDVSFAYTSTETSSAFSTEAIVFDRDRLPDSELAVIDSC